jgi:indolepyruvate ferredoxin oxidoreductase beta subunit
MPVTVTTGKAVYPRVEELLEPLREVSPGVQAFDATALARSAGTAQAMNVVMLGALSRFLPLSEESILEALTTVVPPKYIDVNKKAFDIGKAEVE